MRKAPEGRAVVGIHRSKLRGASGRHSGIPGGPAELPALVGHEFGESGAGPLGNVLQVPRVAHKTTCRVIIVKGAV